MYLGPAVFTADRTHLTLMATEHQTYKVKWRLSNIVKKENKTFSSPLGNGDRVLGLI